MIPSNIALRLLTTRVLTSVADILEVIRRGHAAALLSFRESDFASTELSEHRYDRSRRLGKNPAIACHDSCSWPAHGGNLPTPLRVRRAWPHLEFVRA